MVSLGWISPLKPEVKPSILQPTEGRGLGCPHLESPVVLYQSLSFTKDE